MVHILTYDLEYLTNAAVVKGEKFFHGYSHIDLQEYTKSSFIRVCVRFHRETDHKKPVLPHNLTNTVLSVRHHLTSVKCPYFHENVSFVACGSQPCCRLTDIEVTFNSLTVLERTFNSKPS